MHYIKPFLDLIDAEIQAVLMANEWHKQEGIESFGLSKIETMDEIENYYCSDAYLNSEDSAHIVMEYLTL